MDNGEWLSATPVSLADREAMAVFNQTDSFAEQPEDHQILRKLDASVRALCLTFDQATLFPYFNELPPNDLLYVPVLAVDEINPIDPDKPA